MLQVEQQRDYMVDLEARKAGLRARLAAGPGELELLVQLGTDADPLDDPTAIWTDRERIAAGTLTLDAIVDHADPVIFDPNNVVAGVEVSDDPILALRKVVYGLSYAQRTS